LQTGRRPTRAGDGSVGHRGLCGMRRRRELLELVADWRLVLGDEPARLSRGRQVCFGVSGGSDALLDHPAQPPDELAHPAHEAAEDVITEERDAEREPKTHL